MQQNNLQGYSCFHYFPDTLVKSETTAKETYLKDFETLTNHAYTYCCVSSGYSPAFVVMDLHKMGIFNMPGESDKLLFHMFWLHLLSFFFCVVNSFFFSVYHKIYFASLLPQNYSKWNIILTLPSNNTFGIFCVSCHIQSSF